jgi:hypothetical protein
VRRRYSIIVQGSRDCGERPAGFPLRDNPRDDRWVESPGAPAARPWAMKLLGKWDGRQADGARGRAPFADQWTQAPVYRVEVDA